MTTALEDGRFALACVEARLDGRPLPERRPPCFVDPRHGPSVEDVELGPGRRRTAPGARSAGLRRPPSRRRAARRRARSKVGGARVPYWQGGQAYAPYAGGYYARQRRRT